MPVTLRDLLEVPALDLTLLTGEAGLGVPLRCVHTSELVDPTPWLNGRELLLTTGMSLQGAETQRGYVRRLADAGVAGLGFGVGFDFDKTPPALVEAARAVDLPLVEVPYPVPFIAIAEEVSSRHAEDRVREAQLSVDVHEKLAQLVSAGAGPADVLERLSQMTDGWCVLFGARGEVLARSGEHDGDPSEVWDALPEGLRKGRPPATSADSGPTGSRIAVPIGGGRRREGVLVLGKGAHLETRDRIAVRHGAILLGLLLASRRAAQAAERRVAGDVLQEAFAGRLGGPELARRLELIGFTGDPVAAIVLEGAAGLDPGTDGDPAEQVAWMVESALAARIGVARATPMGVSIAALVPAGGAAEAAAALLDELDVSSGTAVRAGIGTDVERAEARNSYVAALFALRAAPGDVRVATQDSLGAYRLLLGGQPEPVLEGFVRSVLGPLIDRDGSRGSELLRSVQAFVEAGGRWEPGAEELGVHRHTLRYRIHQAEEILGRDLSSPDTQLEVLLALKAREILAV